MNLSNGQPHPFEIPELCSLIPTHLDLRDFTQLCLVSRNFSQLFRPFLWSEIVLEGFEEYRHPWLPWTKELRKNGHLVKYAELHSWFSWDRSHEYYEAWEEDQRQADLENNDLLLAKTLLASCGASLTTLKIEDLSSDGRIWSAFLKRIRSNRTLEGAQQLNRIRVLDLNLTYETITTKLRPLFTRPEKYPEAIVVFASVKELRLVVTDSEDDSPSGSGPSGIQIGVETLELTFWGLARLFPSLRKLTLDNIAIIESRDDEKTRLPELGTYLMTTNQPEYPHLHTLDFQGCSISAKQIVQILERAFNVRSLKIGYRTALEGDAEVLLQSLPRLTPCLTEYEQEAIDFPDWSTVLQGLRCLTRLCISNDALLRDDGLRTLAESCPEIRHLELHGCESLTYRGLRHILRSCAQLRTLWLPMTPVRHAIFEQDLELSSYSITSVTTAAPAAATPSSPPDFVPWACQDTLQDLLLTLFAENDPPELDHAAQQRLQAFTNLRNLNVDYEPLPATVPIGPE